MSSVSSNCMDAVVSFGTTVVSSPSEASSVSDSTTSPSTAAMVVVSFMCESESGFGRGSPMHSKVGQHSPSR